MAFAGRFCVCLAVLAVVNVNQEMVLRSYYLLSFRSKFEYGLYSPPPPPPALLLVMRLRCHPWVVSFLWVAFLYPCLRGRVSNMGLW